MKNIKTDYNPDHYSFIRNSGTRPSDFEDESDDPVVIVLFWAIVFIACLVVLSMVLEGGGK